MNLFTEVNILSVIRRHFNNHKYQLTNSYIFDWECDYFGMTSSNYCYEIEVKISRGDFKADKKKVNKHKELKARFNKIKVPHRFYYCVPTGMITKQEVPDYAGLLYTDGYSITLVKQAPFIHKEKLDLSKILLDKFYYLSLDLKQQINLSKYKKTF